MLVNVLTKILGSKNERELKRLRKTVQQINELEASFQALSDEDLSAKTQEFKDRLQKGETLDGILPEAFAALREASLRVMGMRHFDVQMIGGMSLHNGKIAEMKTGEGKTLVATLAVYLNALNGLGVHVITVNEYLAQRDADWMRPLYEFMGLTVGVSLSGQDPQTKREAYNSDITYGTNNEFGFDYLRDNMALSKEDRVQRGLAFAVVDEVDSILIDEARTPLVISGAAQDSSELYKRMNVLVPQLVEHKETEEGVVEQEGDFVIDLKNRSAELNESGHEKVEDLLVKEGLLEEGDSLYAPSNLLMLHHIHSALRAHVLYHRNVDYIVSNGQVVIVDEHTGRTMPGRRWGEGLHQAIEAKEGVKIQAESQTLASTTFQNYFRLYTKLAGMTGTADTEAFEFREIYGLDVVVIPTNRPIARVDFNDLVFLSEQEKYQAVIEEIKEVTAQKRPVLVGTASIESSEIISKALKDAKIKHNVLNAKNHANEAQVIADAGLPGAVTIATNMAGRGTDIKLGGNLERELENINNPNDEKLAKAKAEWEERHNTVLEAGGLHIIGTERHESRRIDNQLRGRSGRQGDPGSTRFFLSLEDGLMRIFASDRTRRLMQALGMRDGEAIEHKMVSNAIEKAQRKVEGRNFDMRKQLLEYDNVANDQRRVIYQQRNELLEAETIENTIASIREDVINDVISDYIPPQSMVEQWDVEGLEKELAASFAKEMPVQQWLDDDKALYEETLRERIFEEVKSAYKEKEEQVGEKALREFEKRIMLQILDHQWKDHLATMDHLRQGIHLRGYAQKNPKQEYKRESFELFKQLLHDIKHETIRYLSHVQFVRDDEMKRMEEQARAEAAKQTMQYQHESASALAEGEGADESEDATAKPFVRDGKKVGRNEPCPCGSGKKYKQCHGKLD
ncbi:preprotein translocase subunit SecA [Bermanella marisrubri]|uniref:Protein translocase subunit SecA n=1 Tax=Bermanella marisrubri TaxID=207949 RepID=Q1MZP2_9GAMM|nr:preprotein translocase subunit SecA [Bermanella marisrubri]EAT11515.1 preprotein translocase, SecA subunit [Oceanobacter sp. RED65] [Bermanella marisrubri]QIZ85088.1 preprotein translocase subunit SecA [Bermanella marisrubri]